jgi:hypothetical protein
MGFGLYDDGDMEIGDSAANTNTTTSANYNNFLL